MRNYQQFCAAVGLIAGVVACGGDDGGGSSGGSASIETLCQRTCVRAAAKHCGTSTEAACETQCMAQATSVPSACASQRDTFLKCSASATFVCDASSGEADAQGCLNQLNALQSCVDDNDTGSLPTDGGGSLPSADAGTPARSDAGAVADGGTVGHGDAGASGSDAGAGAVCSAEAGDDSCDMCGKTSCCGELTACGSDANCKALVGCLNDCADDDDACSQACADQATDDAVDEYNAFITCYQDSCQTACAGEDPTSGMPGGNNNGEPDGCLPTGVPAGYCTDATHPVGHECHNVTPPGDCVALPNVSDVFCCKS